MTICDGAVRHIDMHTMSMYPTQLRHNSDLSCCAASAASTFSSAAFANSPSCNDKQSVRNIPGKLVLLSCVSTYTATATLRGE